MLDAPVSALVRRPLVRVQRTTPLREAVGLLRQAQTRCLVVMDGESLVGLFTDRDVVERCFSSAVTADTPVGNVMDAPVITVTPDTPVVEALRLIDRERIRNLPLVDADGSLRALIRGRDLTEYIAESMPELVLNQPPKPAESWQREGA
ncbi:MAG: CBS domain-containing protein [Dehalococcoidia bacterium]